MPAHLLPVSRRRFLAGSASALAAVGHAHLLGADSRVDPDCWALLSDTHLLSAESIDLHYKRNRAAMEKRVGIVTTNFERAARQVLALPKRPAGLIHSGDCVHVGGKEEYELLASKLAMLDTIPIHMAMGNHDHRDNFVEVLGEHGESTDRVVLENRHVSTLQSTHANFVVLDSLTMQYPDRPVKGPGRLGSEQLDWIAAALDAERDKPTIVVLHHNIDPSDEYLRSVGKEQVIVESADPFTGLDGGLQDTDQLFELLVSRPHVKAVVFGHKHQFRVFKWQKVLFVSLPPVGYTFGPKEAVGWAKLQLRDGGATLEVQALDPAHPNHQRRVDLPWS